MSVWSHTGVVSQHHNQSAGEMLTVLQQFGVRRRLKNKSEYRKFSFFACSLLGMVKCREVVK
jgi:hypothetical protein